MAEPAVRAQRRLWRLLFPPDAVLLGDDEPPAERFEGAAFPWIEGDGVLAWIASDEAARDPRLAGASLAGAPAEVVRAVHDKAFALAAARAEGLVPPVLRGCLDALEPEALRAPGAADAVEAAVAAWPAWARERFTLKPRLGTSGRGRVAGRAGRLDRARLGRGLERLAERGGAMLEPWLERTADLSVQMHLGDGVTLLGSLEQVVSPAGVFLGHRGEVDSRGRVFSGHADEERLREAAALVGAAARERGYVGPCGLDAFTFVDPEDRGESESESADRRAVLRPVVELNARFTAGTVTVGLVRRVLPRLKRELGLAPGERLRFRFWLALAGDARAAAGQLAREPGAWLLDLDAGDTAPALLFERLERGDD
ncbi:MAG TPA: hypothetical protein VKB65_00970 [Myxococcota bacterium]|nr:hypothetical protein [Myxococcota bacterium]